MMHNKTTGFTLIELMISIAIIGILSAIVFPSYQNNIQKSRRTDAKGALQQFAGAMERRFTIANNYCDIGGANGTGATVPSCGGGASDTGEPTIFSTISPVDGDPNTTSTFYYKLTINAVTVNPASYTLYATPVNNQAADKCGTLTLTNTGVRGIINQTSGVVVADCW